LVEVLVLDAPYPSEDPNILLPTPSLLGDWLDVELEGDGKTLYGVGIEDDGEALSGVIKEGLLCFKFAKKDAVGALAESVLSDGASGDLDEAEVELGEGEVEDIAGGEVEDIAGGDVVLEVELKLSPSELNLGLSWVEKSVDLDSLASGSRPLFPSKEFELLFVLWDGDEPEDDGKVLSGVMKEGLLCFEFAKKDAVGALEDSELKYSCSVLSELEAWVEAATAGPSVTLSGGAVDEELSGAVLVDAVVDLAEEAKLSARELNLGLVLVENNADLSGADALGSEESKELLVPTFLKLDLPNDEKEPLDPNPPKDPPPNCPLLKFTYNSTSNTGKNSVFILISL
jgi:hypothetical protein